MYFDNWMKRQKDQFDGEVSRILQFISIDEQLQNNQKLNFSVLNYDK